MSQTPSPSETSLALREPTAPGLPNEIEWGQLVKVANALAKAQGFIPKHFGGDGYKVLAALMYGRELGFSPMQSLVNIQVIDGKPSLSAHLIAVRVRSAGHKIESTGDATTYTVTITRGDDDSTHSETFTIEQAKRAGLVRAGSGWEKYPEDMLYARALTRCARRHVPDALEGGAIYATEELEDIEPAPPRARVRVIEQEPEEAVGAPAEQPAAPVSAEAGDAAQSGALEEEPAQGATVSSGPAIRPFETTLGNGQKITQYRVHLTTELGERILGPFDTEAEAQRAVETGELPAAAEGSDVHTPESVPDAGPSAAEPRRKGSRGIAPGMTPPPQPELPEPTLEQQLEQSVEATSARHPMLTSTPPPAAVDPFEAPPAAVQPEAQEVMTAAEARLHRIRECAAEIKKIQHDKRGEEIPSEEKLAMEAGQSLDQISKQKYGREFIQLTDDDYQALLDWLEARLQEAEAA